MNRSINRDKLIMLDLPKGLKTPRLLLRPPRTGDGKDIHKAMLDGYEDCVKWLQWPVSPPSEKACELECRHHQASWVLRTDMRFLCFRRDSGKLIGRSAFPDFQCVWETPLVAMSYLIIKSQQGQGFATEAINALSRYAFRCFGAKKLEIKCDIDNIASCRIPEKLGFSEEFTQKGVWPKPGDPLASVRTYACFSEADLPPLEIQITL